MKALHCSILRPAVLPVLLCLLVLPAQAQFRPQGSLNFMLGLPQGEFSEKVDDVGYGGSFTALAGSSRSPFSFGIDLGYLIYGYERRSEPLSTTIPDVRVDVTTSNNIFLGHFLLRVEPPSGMVRPYFDGLLGLKYLYTDTRIDNEGWHDEGDPIAVSTNFDDVALSYGAGGGVNVQVYQGVVGETRPTRMSVLINVGVRYLFGGEANYLKKGSIRRTNGQVSYDVERSETALLTPHIGVTLGF